MSPREVRVLAPAKVNLQLALLGRRADGFRALETWMLAVEPCDRLRLAPRAEPGVALTVDGPFAAGVPTDEGNLVTRAALAYLELGRGGESRGVTIELVKAIPAEAGLGGASSDAAAAWTGLEALYGPVDPAAREAALSRLGSDCTFFTRAAATGFGLCEGRGERVTPERSSFEGHLVLVTPGFGCSTPAVYGAVEPQLLGRRAVARVPAVLLEGGAADEAHGFFNDLEAPAVRTHPEMRSWCRAFEGCEARFHLSGSGSTFFAVLPTAEAARETLERAHALCARAELVPRFAVTARATGHGARVEA